MSDYLKYLGKENGFLVSFKNQNTTQKNLLDGSVLSMSKATTRVFFVILF
jgi:hypothetical protein